MPRQMERCQHSGAVTCINQSTQKNTPVYNIIKKISPHTESAAACRVTWSPHSPVLSHLNDEKMLNSCWRKVESMNMMGNILGHLLQIVIISHRHISLVFIWIRLELRNIKINKKTKTTPPLFLLQVKQIDVQKFRQK